MRITLTSSALLVAGVALFAAASHSLPHSPAPPPAGAAAKAVRAKASARAVASRLEIPASVRREHAELHERLDRAAAAGGDTGARAKKVAALLYPHLEKEERFALPPLGMLRAFADGEVPASADEVLALTEKFRAEYPHMIEEHEAIADTVGELLVAARAEHHDEVADFAQHLLAHAQYEEEVLYPTTILIGEYVKLMVAKDSPPRPGAGLR